MKRLGDASFLWGVVECPTISEFERALFLCCRWLSSVVVSLFLFYPWFYGSRVANRYLAQIYISKKLHLMTNPSLHAVACHDHDFPRWNDPAPATTTVWIMRTTSMPLVSHVLTCAHWWVILKSTHFALNQSMNMNMTEVEGVASSSLDQTM